MQAAVNYRGLFIDAYIGWPGKVHDARVPVNSSLYQRAMNGTLLPDWKRLISDVQVPLIILGAFVLRASFLLLVSSLPILHLASFFSPPTSVLSHQRALPFLQEPV